MSTQLHELSATELLGLYRAKRASPVEAAQACLSRIEALNARLNAFCVVDADRALRAARESEARWMRGTPVGLLDGVPVSIKDLLLTTGWPTLRGSRTVDADQAWDQDAPAVARLREHRAILLGKTTTPEFGWKAVTDSALTGIFGLKPSFGRVPAWPLSLFGTVSHVGPMTRTVEDTALMLDVISKPDARDWFALPYDDRDYRDGLNDGIDGLHIAFAPALAGASVDPEVAGIVARAVAAFDELGAHVVEAAPDLGDVASVERMHWWTGATRVVASIAPERRERIDPGLLRIAEKATAFTLADYLGAVEARATLGATLNQFHERYPILLTPTLPIPAFDAGRLAPAQYGDVDGDWTVWAPFSYPFNLTQQPAASVPCGFTHDGLPVGLQIVGPMHDDRLVLRVARAFEKAQPWHASYARIA